MSIRTVVEINHDLVHRIDDNRYEFCNLINEATKSTSSKAWEELERYGVRLVVSAHHSEIDDALSHEAVRRTIKAEEGRE